jgi:Zinc finger, C3HC4 type (RING finger)/Ankyrin repeats (3 copies)
MISKIFYLLFIVLNSQIINATNLAALTHAGKWDAVEEVLQCPTCNFNVNGRWVEENFCSVSPYYNRRVCILGHTPMHHAAMAGEKLTVELLLKNGANPHLIDYMGWAAIDHAKAGKHWEIVQLLIDYGAVHQQKPHSFFSTLLSQGMIVGAVLGLGALLFRHQYISRVSSTTYQSSPFCIICLVDFSNFLLRAAQLLPCGHNNVCSGCQEKWLDISRTCPECRGATE